MWWAVLAAELAAIVSVVVALRGGRLPAEHRAPARPLLALLIFAVVVDVLLAVGDCRVLGAPKAVLAVVVPCVSPAPRSSLTSAVRLGEQALVMAWSAALAVGAWRVFDSRERAASVKVFTLGAGGTKSGVNYSWPMHPRGSVHFLQNCAIPGFWLLAVAVLVLGRPYGHPGDDPQARHARAEVVARLLLGVDLLAVAASAAAVVRAWQPGRRWARSPAHVAVLALLVTEAAVALIGPYVRDPYADWDYARALYLPGFLAVAWAFVRALLRARAGRLPAAP